MHVWRKTVRSDRVDSWTESLAARVDPQRIVVFEKLGGHTSRIEVYSETAQPAAALREQFGGVVREVRAEDWHPQSATAPGKPLSIGGTLLITGRETELAALRREHPAKSVLCIPAAMAFGTGEHATTAMCARLLLDVARRRAPERWDMLDLGTGSGILALAGMVFGANGVLGVDNDPHAVRIARENAGINGLVGRGVRFDRAELPKWPMRPARTWPVVTANLFSELLVELMPEIIAPAVSGGGDLILSGILGTQIDDVLATTKRERLELATMKKRGRWRALHLRKPPV